MSITHEAVSIPGSDAAFAYHLSVDVVGGSQRVRVTGYEVGALVGQIEIDLSAQAAGTTTFSLNQAVALMATATDRVRAAA